MTKKEILDKNFLFRSGSTYIESQGIYDAMDEYMTQCCLELLEYMAKNEVDCVFNMHTEKSMFLYKGEWITKEEMFKNFL